MAQAVGAATATAVIIKILRGFDAVATIVKERALLLPVSDNAAHKRAGGAQPEAVGLRLLPGPPRLDKDK